MRLSTAALLAVILVSAARAQSAGPSMKENPDAYWNRAFSCAQTASTYNISLQTADVNMTAAKIDQLMSQGGAPNQPMHNNSIEGQSQRSMSYFVPVKSADKLAKKLMDMGELLNYSMNRQNNRDTLLLVEERIAVLQGEIDSPALAQTTAAAHFVKTRLDQLKQVREMCVEGSKRSSIALNLRGKTTP